MGGVLIHHQQARFSHGQKVRSVYLPQQEESRKRAGFPLNRRPEEVRRRFGSLIPFFPRSLSGPGRGKSRRGSQGRLRFPKKGQLFRSGFLEEAEDRPSGI